MQMEAQNNQSSLDELLDELDRTIMMLGRLMSARHSGEECDITLAGPRLMLMRVLNELCCLKIGDLAGLLGIKAPAATSLIDSLERDGLVAREHDTEDRRVTLVTLTDAGKAALHEAEQVRRDHMRQYMSVLSEEDIRSLIRIQRTLIAAIVEND